METTKISKSGFFYQETAEGLYLVSQGIFFDTLEELEEYGVNKNRIDGLEASLSEAQGVLFYDDLAYSCSISEATYVLCPTYELAKQFCLLTEAWQAIKADGIGYATMWKNMPRYRKGYLFGYDAEEREFMLLPESLSAMMLRA